MARYAMVIDSEKCVGCQSCTVACKSEWDVPNGSARTRVRPAGTTGTYPNFKSSFYVAQCNNCDHPTCVPACPTGATSQGKDGLVRIDKALCIGCGSCVAACPYGARYVNPETDKVDKCDFCSARTDKGIEPACVATCPARAKTFGNLEDRNSRVFDLVYNLGARRNETADIALGPNVYYTGKPEHIDAAFASFVPQPPRIVPAGQVWAKLARKLVYLMVTATFAGQAVAFFRQLAVGEKQFDE